MKSIDSVLMMVAVAVTASACYKYTPISSPELGMDVRARLETGAAVRRSSGLVDPVVQYDGTVVDYTPDALLLDVLIARSSNAIRDVEIRDTIRIETTEVQSIMQRRISPVRSAAFTLAAGAAAVAVIAGIDAIVGGTGDEDGDGPPQANRVPLLSWKGVRLLANILGAGRD